MAYIEKSHTGKWYVRFRDKSTKKLQRLPEGGCHTEKEAEHIQRQVENDEYYSKLSGFGIINFKLPINELWDRYLKELEPDSSERTTYNKSKLSKLFVPAFATLANLSKQAIQKWADDLKKKKPKNKELYAISSIALTMKTFKAFLNWLVKNDYLQKNPMIGIKIPTPQKSGRVLEQDEITNLLRCAPSLLNLMLQIGLVTGARIGEIMNLRLALIEGNTWVIPKEESKTKKRRALYLSDYIIREFRLLADPVDDKQYKPLYAYARGSKFYREWKSTKARAGIVGRLKFHHLRHTFATEHAKVHKDAFALKESLGWTTIKTAEYYVHQKEDYTMKLQSEVNLIHKSGAPVEQHPN